MAKNPHIRNSEDEIARENDGTFSKGKSGNPGGLPKWQKEFREAFGERCAPKAERVLNRVLDRALEVEDIEKALKMASEQDDATGIIRAEMALSERYKQATAAADVVLKYVLPKPKTEVELSGPGGAPLVPEAPSHDALTPQQRLAIVLKSVGVLAQHGGFPAFGDVGGVDSQSSPGATGGAGGGSKGE